MEGGGGPRLKRKLFRLLIFLTVVLGVTSVTEVGANETDINALGGEFEAAFQGKCGTSSPCVQLCVELHDGTFECQCRPGYRLLLDGYSCVELGNSTYSDDDDSDELEADVDYSPSDQKPSIVLKAAKLIAAPAPISSAKPSSSLKSASNDDSSMELEGRPLPRPAASSTYQRRKSKPSKDEESIGALAAAKAEALERNNYLRKFAPIDDPGAGPIDYFGLGPEVMAKAAAKGLKLSPSTSSSSSGGKKTVAAGKKSVVIQDSGEYSGEDDDNDSELGDDDEEEDDDATNEAEEDLGSMEAVAAALKAKNSGGMGVPNYDKDHIGGGENYDAEEEDSEEDFILPPRALPLKEVKNVRLGNALSPSNTPTSFTPSTAQRLSGDVVPPPPPPSQAPQVVVTPSPSPPPPSLPAKDVEACPLKCNRGQCIKESLDELGFRCLCPMGTKGSFCEVVELFEEGGGYNSGLFRGESWVAFPVLHDAYMADQISLEFRPQSPNGILLLTGERDDLSGDYLALFLKDGYLVFRFDCGSGSALVRSNAPVKLEQWNKASIVRRRWDGWMQLNDGPFTQGRSKGLFSRITFRQPVYIGGQGNITFNSVSSIQSNFDDEPELVVSSSSSLQANVVNDAYTTTTTTTNVVGSTFTSASSTTPSSSSPTQEQSTSSVAPSSISGESGQIEMEKMDGEKYKNLKNVAAGDANSNENEDSGTVEVLKKVGGFQGCIRNLVINERAYRFGLEPAGDSLQGFDIENCNDQGVCDLVKCQHGGQCLVQKDLVQCLCPLGFTGLDCSTPLDLQIPSFNGSSYLKYGGLGLTRVLSWLELEVVIKPDAMDGLIMYNGYKTDGMGDFISLIIDQGYIEFAMDLGTGAAIIRSDAPIVLGEWHHIHISRTSRLISLRIDNQSPLMALTPGAFTQLSLPHNLFLGGIPEPEWLSPKVKVQGGFTGCIQKLVINEKPLRIMGSAMSGVNLENCEHPCLRNPCNHGGDCVPQLDTFKCHCPLGFRDPYCQTRMDKEDKITSPKFIGDSYLRFTHPRIIKRLSGWRLNLSFRLKTESSRGLLVYAGRKWMTSASDFISMGLRNGLLTASFSLGSGQTTIAYNYTTVNDGRWHRVILVRNEQEASLSVDDGPPVTGIAPGKLRQLNINDGLYIGGLEESRHHSVNRYMEGFMGCLTDLVLGSERVALLQEASEGRNVDYCD